MIEFSLLYILRYKMLFRQLKFILYSADFGVAGKIVASHIKNKAFIEWLFLKCLKVIAMSRDMKSKSVS